METYGEKPRIFTEKWWENYFYYYKIHTIVAIVVLLVGGYLIYTDVTATKYDLQIDYISEFGISTMQTEAIAAAAEECIADVTGNDILDAYVMSLDMKPSADMQYTQAMQVKYMTEQAYSDAFTFIVSKEFADQLSGVGFFEPISEWADTDSEGEYISLSGCSALESGGVPVDDLYVAVRKMREDELDDETKIAEHQNGIVFARFLINER